jgi:acyl-[acyl-carrier-protein]-phospholipid O-acyltransferase/long-chain-fatty-acid--[acyl-carrier-protein] ligase
MNPLSKLTRLLVVQAQVAFNDNASKLVLAGLANFVLSKSEVEGAVSLMASLLVLPFILFSPLFGWVADRYPKTMVLRVSLLFQVIICLAISLAVFAHSYWVASAGFFLLALQATAFSPAKQGAVKEIVGSEHLNAGVSLIEATTVAAILTGGFVGGYMLDLSIERFHSPWTGAGICLLILSVASFTAWLLFLKEKPLPAQGNAPFRASLFWEHISALKSLTEKREYLTCSAGSAYFYGIGGILYLLIMGLGRDAFPNGTGAATYSGILLLLLGGGIITGALLYAKFSSKRPSLSLTVPLGALGMGGTLFALALLSPTSLSFKALTFLTGVAGSFFVIPLNSDLQDKVPADKRGSILAAANLLTNIVGILAVILTGVLTKTLGHHHALFALSLSTILVGIVMVASNPQLLIKILCLIIAKVFYRVKKEGEIPKEGGVLLVANHVSYIDAFIVHLYAGRPVRFLAYAGLFKVPVLGSILKLANAIPVSPTRASEATKKAVESLKAGEVICIFPEGELTRTGSIGGFKRGVELIAQKSGSTIVPLYLDSFWGSIFSFHGGKYFWKYPTELPKKLHLIFGSGLPSTTSAHTLRQAILDLSAHAWQRKIEEKVDRGIGFLAAKRLATNPSSIIIEDFLLPNNPQRISACNLLAAAWGFPLPKELRGNVANRRCGIILPPGIPATIANLSLSFAGITPVHLNPTIGKGAAQECLTKGEITHIITSKKTITSLKDFPWETTTNLLVEEILPKLKTSPKTIAGILLSYLGLISPSLVALIVTNFKKVKPTDEATLLFTSGSSGSPKGVSLSHCNLAGNIEQIVETGVIKGNNEDKILGCIPLFHSFGQSFTLWLPLLQPLGLVTSPSPLDPKGIGKAINEGKATILMGTPTFLRTYARKIENFSPIRLIISGAEKLPNDLKTLYKEKYNLDIYEGYGLTECSPVLSVNLPNPVTGTGAPTEQIAHREGSTGRLLPGVSYRLIPTSSLETWVEIVEGNLEQFHNGDPSQTGVLAVRGVNIFSHYEKNEEATKSAKTSSGWFITGDVARVDQDGFLFIEGRISRFAKIGGEMVPLNKVEGAIKEAFGGIDESSEGFSEGFSCALVCRPHPSKGEELVLLTTSPLSNQTLRNALPDFPNLWIPKVIIEIKEIPMLGSGKVDYQSCNKVALEVEVEIEPSAE